MKRWILLLAPILGCSSPQEPEPEPFAVNMAFDGWFDSAVGFCRFRFTANTNQSQVAVSYRWEFGLSAAPRTIFERGDGTFTGQLTKEFTGSRGSNLSINRTFEVWMTVVSVGFESRKGIGASCPGRLRHAATCWSSFFIRTRQPLRNSSWVRLAITIPM